MFDPVDFEFGLDADAAFATTLPWSTPSSLTSSPILPPADVGPDASASALEREICTNFSCCGLAIPDMHDLLAHFDERHVLSGPFTDPHAKPLTLAFPRPLTPPARTALPVLTHSPSSASNASLSSPTDVLTFPDFPSAPDVLHSSSTLAHNSRPSPSPSPTPRALPPASFFAQSTKGAPPSSAHRERGAGGRFKPRTPATPAEAAATGGVRPASTVGTRPSTTSGTRPVNVADTRSADDQPRRRTRDRERQFRCPKPGCVKTYLNPNGLKYHLDKGTCKITAAEHS
ncbi:hypothetical protein K488DRAFT_72069 [Vararia minispora EC-137]|uniref:Uncharacterized protein n=1 Tax=Vararia minispora EC-137 TaxID=1314806 RepID=A0ACB8QG05_9AGAM|nr:hypothetical protein K488DRAFT_72069 [Vararia minispora EC-137]